MVSGSGLFWLGSQACLTAERFRCSLMSLLELVHQVKAPLTPELSSIRCVFPSASFNVISLCVRASGGWQH